MAHLQKSKNKDFGGVIVQKQYVVKGYTVKLCFEEVQHWKLTAQNSHIIQFPLTNFARMCENLLASGLLDINELA